jgi:UDP:flavonoid glycosyltransferase YjiC (YdhE family)
MTRPFPSQGLAGAERGPLLVRVIACSFGSAGDFLPTLAIAAALQRRAHDVSFVGNPGDADRVRSAGLDFIPAGAAVDVRAKVEQNPGYGDVGGAGKLLQDLVAPHIEATYRVVGDVIRAGAVDVVVTNDAGYGALWAAAEARVPSVLVHPSPVIWMGWHDPIVIGRPLNAHARHDGRDASAASRRVHDALPARRRAARRDIARGRIVSCIGTHGSAPPRALVTASARVDGQ